ncbi:ABC transporter ATP-binding protein [Streptococcus ovuberis]|uniref:ABC transporter ATP-binding protein n=1 Tax=Streptococcus ovuberis TaxID=1936207 RepID=A0A7X6N068_9STRE|nr:ABC transporter ATP-binding protein [Streptococcus ovuberis]NKZ19644.1 ABC transporter ATP-binding protein [Streptococcus ovuberis]
MTKVIEVSSLSKTIKGKSILSDISFDIYQGDCIALIGPNGAGKTTLMSCLLGDKLASQGTITIQGLPVRHPELRTKMAVLSQENRVPGNLKVQELLDFFKSIAHQHLSDGVIDAYLQFSPEQKKQLADKLSGGQKRLLSFVLCLIGQPSIIFLDEPTAGMDTSTRQRFWEIISQLKSAGRTIIYSSHYIEEVEHTAERILVLHQGKLLKDTTPFAMRREDNEKEVTLSKDYLDVVRELPILYDVEIKTDVIRFMTKDIDKLWDILQEHGCRITDIEVQNKTLLHTLFDKTQEDEQ